MGFSDAKVISNQLHIEDLDWQADETIYFTKLVQKFINSLFNHTHIFSLTSQKPLYWVSYESLLHDVNYSYSFKTILSLSYKGVNCIELGYLKRANWFPELETPTHSLHQQHEKRHIAHVCIWIIVVTTELLVQAERFLVNSPQYKNANFGNFFLTAIQNK